MKAPRFMREFLSYQLKEVEQIYKNDDENIKAFYRKLNEAVYNYERGLLTLHETMQILNEII